MRGGKRAGAGRKTMPPMLKKTPRSVKLPEWLWRWMDRQKDTNRAVIIEDAVTARNKLKPPK